MYYGYPGSTLLPLPDILVDVDTVTYLVELVGSNSVNDTHGTPQKAFASSRRP
jgi:hypothetical protein